MIAPSIVPAFNSIKILALESISFTVVLGIFFSHVCRNSTDLKAGTIDGAIIDNAVAMYYLKQGADKDLKLVGEPTKAPGTVLGVKKGNKELQDAVNKALKELKEDGTYQKIYDKWFGDYNKK